MKRRSFLVAIPAFGLSGVLGMAVAAKAVDPHMAWFAEWLSIRSAFESGEIEAEDAQFNEVWGRFEAIGGEIATTPAHTAQGQAAKLSWLLEDGCYDFGCASHKDALVSVIDQLKLQSVMS